MTPEELSGRLSNQKVLCSHNAKVRQPGLCKNCRDVKPYTVFLMCKGANCDHKNECGYFWGPGAKDDMIGKSCNVIWKG
jgi:hypothetical protein